MLRSQDGKGGASLVTKPRNITFNAWRGEYSVQFLYLPLEIIADIKYTANRISLSGVVKYL